MARTLRRLTPALGALPIALLWAAPLGLSIVALIPTVTGAQAWQLLLQHPQLWPGLGLSLFTGVASTVLALAASLLILAGLQGTGTWRRLQAFAAAGLAMPHLAFAIGFGFLVMPSGLLARLLIGGDAPPGWITVQDPLGLSLTLALALKEIPFLLTAGFAALSRGDAAERMVMEMRAAASLGHGAGSAWLRIALPQLLPSLAWPLVIVFVYGATVVDMALVLGPTQPPTLSVVIWHALNDADPAVNAMGLAGTLLLTATLLLAIALAAGFLRLTRVRQRQLLTRGPSSLGLPRRTGLVLGAGSLGVLVLCILLLALLSVAPRWPYPAVLPPAIGFAAWGTFAASPGPLWLSLALSFIVAASAVSLAVLWFETQPPARDGWPLGMALLALALPQLAIAGGQYRLFLALGLTGTLPGLFLAHLTPATAYALIVLQGPYRAFDTRYIKAARALSASGFAAWVRVKLPLLKAPLLTSAAIAFAVSIALFVPAQLIAAGRYATLPMEAVTLSSGGNRALTAAFALALAVPPLLAFLAAALLGRPRWR